MMEGWGWRWSWSEEALTTMPGRHGEGIWQYIRAMQSVPCIDYIRPRHTLQSTWETYWRRAWWWWWWWWGYSIGGTAPAPYRNLDV